MTSMRECHFCSGTGLDYGDFTGRCFWCAGGGWVDDEPDEQVDDYDDDELCTPTQEEP